MSKNLDKYLKLMRKLNQMQESGGDEAACDWLRDSLDPLWLKLTPEEVAESKRVLSAEFKKPEEAK